MTTFTRRLAAILLCTPCALASAAPPRYPSLEIVGTVHPNACSPAAKSALRAVFDGAAVREPAQAWRLIDTLLCAEKTRKNQGWIRAAMAPKIKAQYDGTAQETSFEIVIPSDDSANAQMAGAAAWDASLGTDQAALVLHYWSDEATVQGRTIELKKGRWIITKTGSASD